MPFNLIYTGLLSKKLVFDHKRIYRPVKVESVILGTFKSKVYHTPSLTYYIALNETLKQITYFSIISSN